MSLFYSAVTRDPVNGVPTSEGTSVSNEQLENMYTRDSEGDYKSAQIRKIANTYRNPSEYFNQKAQALDVATKAAAKIFRDEYKKLTKNLIPNKIALVRAKRLADAHLDAQIASIEEDFPSSMQDLSLKLAAGHGQLANTGFAQGDTDLKK